MRVGGLPLKLLTKTMHLHDLQTYQYDLPRPLRNVLAVGWLAAGHDYSKGSVESALLGHLKRALLTHRANQMRGFHLCDLCAQPRLVTFDVDGSVFHLGSAEIWIPAHGTTAAFASPDLILHYITAHQYKPSAEFLEALANIDSRPDWNAALDAERLLNDAFIA